MRGDLCKFDHGVDPVVIDDVLPGQPLPPQPPPLAAAAPGIIREMSSGDDCRASKMYFSVR